jgi:NAD(P)-dependent dehydrogenase (short-subunit alcohol dehydrogenase family)
MRYAMRRLATDLGETVMSEIILITGGGRGIGAATAELAAHRGYDVFINYRADHAAAEAVAARVRDAGQRCAVLAGDVANEADVVNLFEACDRDLGPLSGLVNNAGTVGLQTRVEAMDAARINTIFAVNVTGSFLCAREAVKRMSTKHGGHGGSIVNLSSAASRLGSPNEFVDYAATKGAIDTFTLGLAKEVATEGIRVNAIRPGLIDTEIHAASGEPGRIDRLRSAIPMQREGSAMEVAEAVLWLLSPASGYTTGSFIDVAGGR